MQGTENPATEVPPDMNVNLVSADRHGAGNRTFSWRKLLRLTVFGILVGVGGAYLAYKYQIDLAKWRSAFGNAKPYFVICHWILIACAWIYWPELVSWGLKKKFIRPDEEVEMRSGSVRFRLLGFLVAFELLIVMQVQNLIYSALIGH